MPSSAMCADKRAYIGVSIQAPVLQGSQIIGSCCLLLAFEASKVDLLATRASPFVGLHPDECRVPQVCFISACSTVPSDTFESRGAKPRFRLGLADTALDSKLLENRASVTDTGNYSRNTGTVCSLRFAAKIGAED